MLNNLNEILNIIVLMKLKKKYFSYNYANIFLNKIIKKIHFFLLCF